MNISNNPEFNRIMNLIRFNVNFTKYEHTTKLEIQSPDYVLEKYNHWIGFEPTIDHKMYTPDDMTDFFNKYWKTWKLNCESIESGKLKNILMYLYSTQNMNLLNMFNKFEEYIGPASMINSTSLKGLHVIMERDFVPKVIEKNKENITIVLRDLKIKEIIS
jgi:hypothetical protein